jgi:hypothetical protein
MRFQPPKEIAEKFQPPSWPRNKEQQDTSSQKNWTMTHERGEQQQVGIDQTHTSEQRERWNRKGNSGRSSQEGESFRNRQERTLKSHNSEPPFNRPHSQKKRMNTVRIWVLDEKKNLKPVMVKTGLNDNRFVEIIEGEITEGDEIVVGMTGGESQPMMGQQQTNPFQPRMPGGGGRRGF